MNTFTDAMQPSAVTTSSNTNSQDTLALVGRVLLAALFLIAGINKIGGVEGTSGYIASVGLPFPELLYWATLALEIIAPIMLIVGYKARYAAIALGVFSIAAAVFFHADFADQQQMTSFLKNFAVAGGLFFVAAFGPGRFSLDRG
ncbi:DoxX family protein [Erythrobacter sp. SCSIO 43205]|uniref:DoxX family protein n=1 Tax=Erythrobacter sp. SCSIO 43205 TaxID=2779361 RepID=UPI001CA7CE8C|nr:DoxX family protein [Erythrobacter sp. SCSIO 43205]UAB77523.1 DoxX family protein [Erythrobacter sp. SCSIO 43205]